MEMDGGNTPEETNQATVNSASKVNVAENGNHGAARQADYQDD